MSSFGSKGSYHGEYDVPVGSYPTQSQVSTYRAHLEAGDAPTVGVDPLVVKFALFGECKQNTVDFISHVPGGHGPAIRNDFLNIPRGSAPEQRKSDTILVERIEIVGGMAQQVEAGLVSDPQLVGAAVATTGSSDAAVWDVHLSKVLDAFGVGPGSAGAPNFAVSYRVSLVVDKMSHGDLSVDSSTIFEPGVMHEHANQEWGNRTRFDMLWSEHGTHVAGPPSYFSIEADGSTTGAYRIQSGGYRQILARIDKPFEVEYDPSGNIMSGALHMFASARVAQLFAAQFQVRVFFRDI